MSGLFKVTHFFYFCRMRWMKFTLLGILLLLGIYAVAMYFFVEESKSFRVEKTIDYPVEKVFPQFNNLQNFTRWNNYFVESKKITTDFYSPYEGKGAAMSFQEDGSEKSGEMFIRYENPNSTLKYQLFEKSQANPYLINIKFKPLSANQTKLIWTVSTPRVPLLKRSVNLWTESDFVENLDKSMKNLTSLLSNKVDKDKQMAAIKYDSLMVEKDEGSLILGVNVSTSNKKDALFKNIVLNHNKVYNYITTDLQKRDDEFGLPVLLTDANNYKDKEVSYFYGIPLSKRVGVSDNNFSFRTVNPSQTYVMYYKGNYAGRVRAIQQLLNKAKKDTMRNGQLQQTFIEVPTEGSDVAMKIALPVYK